MTAANIFFIVHGRKILKVDGRDPQNREKKILLEGDRAGD
jgi:hypothetical protein